MPRKNRSYTDAFRAEAVRMARRSQVSTAQVARELGMHAEVLRRWIRQARPTDPEAAAAPPESLEAVNRRLMIENARLREERDILKKAMACFASDRP
jgi:transposase